MERSNSLQNNFFIVANICAVFLPCTTIVMALDVFLLSRITGLRRSVGPDGTSLSTVSWEAASPGNVIGIVAIMAGLIVGAITGGLIPYTAGFGKTNVGIPALEAWLTASVIYVGGMFLVRFVQSPRAKQVLLGLPAAPGAGPGSGVTIDLTTAPTAAVPTVPSPAPTTAR